MKNRLIKASIDLLNESSHSSNSVSDKPMRIDKLNSANEFWKKNTKQMKVFNPNIRPSATYEVDTNLAFKHVNKSSDKFESTFYETEVHFNFSFFSFT